MLRKLFIISQLGIIGSLFTLLLFTCSTILFLLDNNFPNIGALKYLNVFCDMENDCIGQIKYDGDKIAYFYCHKYRLQYDHGIKIVFSEQWQDLYGLVPNYAMKIECYSFLFESN